MTTRAQALADAVQRFMDAGIAPSDARTEAAMLLRHVSGATREELFLRPHTVLTHTDAERFAALVERRAVREPLAYLVGTRDFYGLAFTVTPDVLIPRPETEGVVERAVAAFPETVLDLCTGSGAIAIAVAVSRPDACVWATDISDAALAVAKRNAERHSVAERVSFLAGDLFAPIAVGLRFDVIAANPPYIAPEVIETLEPEVRRFEPRIALGVHADALHFYRRIAGESGAFLKRGGCVVVEIGQGQANDVRELFRLAGFDSVEAFPDLAGIERVVVATDYRGRNQTARFGVIRSGEGYTTIMRKHSPPWLGAGILLVGYGATLRDVPVQAQQAAPRVNPVVPETIYTPDTPANRALCAAVDAGNIPGIKAALAKGANTETVIQRNGAKEPGFPVVISAEWGDMSGDRDRALAMFRLLVPHVKNVNLRETNCGTTLLMAAVESGDLSLVKSIVERGANLEAGTAVQETPQPYGNETALYQAVMRNGNRSVNDPDPITAYLIERGANVNHVCADGSTALMRAAQNNKVNTVRLLLAKGADPTRRDNRDMTALRRASSSGADAVVALLIDRTPINLWEAAALGKSARVKELLAAGANPNDPRPRPNSAGEMPLTAAMKSDDPATVKVLMDAGANVSYAHPASGRTALHVAATYGSNDVIPLLLAAGADVNANAIKTDDDAKPKASGAPADTSLTCAVQSANADTVALLLKSGVQMAKHGQGNDALQRAIRSAGRAGLWLRDHKARRVNTETEHDTLEAQGSILEQLVNAGADLNASGAVCLVAQANQPGILAYFLEKGASPDAHAPTTSATDETALMAAIDGIGMAQADIGEIFVNAEDKAEQAEADTESARDAGECLVLLLKADANVSEAARESGETPFMRAVSMRLFSVAADLLKRGAKIDAVDKSGLTALSQVAAEGEDVQAAQWLVTHGANVNHIGSDGYTALMLAIDNGENAEWEADQKENAAHIESEREHMREFHGSSGEPEKRPNDTGHPAMVGLLLKSGADKTVAAKDGVTALSFAKRNGFKAVEKLLQSPP